MSSEPSGLRIAVIGVGPVGSILAGHLAAADEDVRIVDILRNHVDVIREEGLHIGGMLDMTVKVPKTSYSIAELADEDLDVIFICVKASFLPIIIRELSTVYKPGTKVVCYQNGMDNELQIAEAFGKDNTLRVVINYAGNFIADGKVTMNFFHKPNYIGVLTEDNIEFANRVAAMMTRADLETEYTDIIRTYVWEKVILNAALAPLSAITGMTMKEVTTFDDTIEMMKDLLREGITVGERDGCEFQDGFFDHCVWYLSQAGHHKPSMLIDIENRSPTEIDYLNARICHHGDNYDIPVPVNRTITQLIRALDLQNKRAKEAERQQ
jgi:2-dehydropantoate 2-reductase